MGGYITDARAFANLFFRYARGLGAYDPLGVPFRTGTIISTGRAEEIRLALSANWEWRENPNVGFGIQIGGWWRLFRDADPGLFDRSAISEGALALRPMVLGDRRTSAVSDRSGRWDRHGRARGVDAAVRPASLDEAGAPSGRDRDVPPARLCPRRA